MNTRIRRVRAWQALDSRGRPTVACRIELNGGAAGTALAPSGASAGSHEARELRDGGPAYQGRGVLAAVANINGILAQAVTGLDASNHGEVDAVLARTDRSEGFSRLGANAILAVSLASALAGAAAAGRSLARDLAGSGELLLPMPMVNIISGGAHAGRALDVQDFLVLPLGAKTFSQAVEWAVAVREAAAARTLRNGNRAAVLVADEGGLGIALPTNKSALELLTRSIEDAGLRPGIDAGIAVDVAASELWTGERYEFLQEQRTLTSAQLIEEISGWCRDFPILSIEDPLDEDDWDGWARITETLGDRVQLIGDDLFVTQLHRLRRGIANGAANSVLIKVNQNGLLSATRDVLAEAQTAGYSTVVSARSGDTEESWLADLAVGLRAGQIKVGSTHRSERNSKWNRLLELEATETTTFAGPWPGTQPHRLTDRQ